MLDFEVSIAYLLKRQAKFNAEKAFFTVLENLPTLEVLSALL